MAQIDCDPNRFLYHGTFGGMFRPSGTPDYGRREVHGPRASIRMLATSYMPWTTNTVVRHTRYRRTNGESRPYTRVEKLLVR
jgi:hypothetical protein